MTDMQTPLKQRIPVSVRVYLCIAVVFQLFVIAWMFVRAEQTKAYALAHGTVIRLSCTAYDPYDPFKGRYVRLTIDEDDVRAAGERLGLDLSALVKTARDYYMQENYARAVDNINWHDFNELHPILELYVDGRGNAIQKALLVHDGGSEIAIEDYIA